MIIRRTTAVMGIFLAVSLFLPAVALANAMPVYMEQYPSLSIAPREELPLRVDRERLTVEIEEQSSETALVTARYTLTNTAAGPLSVPMVFPYISKGYGGFEPAIECNGENVGYKVFSAGNAAVDDYLDDPEGFLEQVAIERIIANLNKPPYEPLHFSDTAAAALYKVTYKRPVERRCRIGFTLDPEQTRVLAFGFNGFEMDRDGKAALSTYISEKKVGETGYILVLGADTLAIEENDYDDTIEKEEVIAGDFIAAMIETAVYDIENWDKDDFYSLLLRGIDGLYERGQLIIGYDDLVSNAFYHNNISALLYEVELAPGSTNELLVTFPMRATIDRRESVDFVNTFAYLLHPARNFQEFGGIDISVKLNAQYPYIIASSIELVEEETGVYSASLDHLPQEDLVFSTYPRPEITLLDRMQARFLPRDYGGQLLMVFMLLIGLGFLTVLLIRKSAKNS